MRKVCVVTGTRAEYGLLYWLMRAIRADRTTKLQLVVTGMHLSPEFGLTYKSISKDGFKIDEKVEILLFNDTPVGIAKSIGLGTAGFAEAFARLKPDIVVLLGDRYELLAAAQAALVARIPIAHISGGESTVGAIDEAVRHSITKMSALHFVAAEPYRRRVIQLGESPERVFNVGDPGLENIRRLRLLSLAQLESLVSLDLKSGYFLVALHPATLLPDKDGKTAKDLFRALDAFPDKKVIITKANSDTGGRVINRMIETYASSSPGRIFSSPSLGSLNFLSALKHSSCLIGNSSSGIVEAPYLNVPTVNIGMRQEGRMKAISVIDCGESPDSIRRAIKRALSPQFRSRIKRDISLYGDGNTSAAILRKIRNVNLSGLLVKRFYDIPGRG